MANAENVSIDEILGKLSKEILSNQQVFEILGKPREVPTELIDKLSVETALQFWNLRMSFEEGDAVMNNIYQFWIGNEYYRNYEFPAIAWECYLAFDAGEYIRANDSSETDPAEKYTRPQIGELLRKRSLIL